MKLIKSEKFDPNHSAMVVKIDEFIPHKNADKLKCCKIGTYNIITSIDAEPGLYVYFQKESRINSNFLSYANLFRDGNLNSDSSQTGMFEDTGRIKVIKLRGELSEGFIIPAVVFENFLLSVTNKSYTLVEGDEFDAVEHNGKSFWIIKKYKVIPTQGSGRSKRKGKKTKDYSDVLVPGQFQFHYNTTVIKKCPHVIHPDDKLNISEKIHGTSFISANVLCKVAPNNIIDKAFCWLSKYIKWIWEPDLEYRNLYASRTTIKNLDNANSGGYYNSDVWFYANELIKNHLKEGMTVYGEIVGYCPTGQAIQKGYDYGCVPPKEGESYTHEKHYKVRVYRVTMVEPDGKFYEFNPEFVRKWCENTGLTPVTTWYEGVARDLYPELKEDLNWSEEFINKLSDDKRFYMELNSPSCKNSVPHEGVVIKIFGKDSEAFKLKCFKFLDKEQKDQDKGISNIEDEA